MITQTNMNSGTTYYCRILSPSETARMIGISKTGLRRLMAKGEFVGTVKLSDRRIGFRIADINAWIETRTTPPQQVGALS
jgi:predicted DNA-binding transcriptional regulator AlpA